MRRSPAVHPGVILLNEVMQPYEISQNALARLIGVSPRRINEIVLGKRAITPDTAVGLEEALGIPAQFWMKLQVEYEVERARGRRAALPRKPQRPRAPLDPWNTPLEGPLPRIAPPWGFMDDEGP